MHTQVIDIEKMESTLRGILAQQSIATYRFKPGNIVSNTAHVTRKPTIQDSIKLAETIIKNAPPEFQAPVIDIDGMVKGMIARLPERILRELTEKREALHDLLIFLEETLEKIPPTSPEYNKIDEAIEIVDTIDTLLSLLDEKRNQRSS